MKKLAYISLVLLIMLSCKEQAMKNDKAYEVVEETFIEDDVSGISEINSYETLSIQKLTEYFDLLKLKAEHPEFEESIISQLENYTSESLIKGVLSRGFTIENIDQMGGVKKISDSVSKIQFQFDIVSENTTLKDSVFAIVTSKDVVLEGEVLKSIKVLLSKE